MPNRLAEETSPYLLQHANNPVDWFPWGEEAFARASAEDKPIFLSIGYSACHWCHVMEHESFENEAIARQLNAGFISIKVDREERPDLDHIYMNAVQSIAGRGGWPMSVFLTPERQPFFGGTYYPPTSRMNMPGFDRILAAVLDGWKNRRKEMLEQAQRLTDHLQQVGQFTGEQGELSVALLNSAAVKLERMFDHRFGGFGGAPKFPHPMDLQVLLRQWRRSPHPNTLAMVTHTLDKMASGGIYDQLGGGFHRYSVDDRWLVPHFEKMLYDNALLTSCYLEAYQATCQNSRQSSRAEAGGTRSVPATLGPIDYARVVRETLDYVLREMTHERGGFYSTQDADSEGVEGKFYVWTPDEVQAVLGEPAAKTFCYCYDVSDLGNFEKLNILNRPKTLEQCGKILNREPAELERELSEGRSKLLAVRNARIWPGLDDKVLVSWNGLMIQAFAQAACVLDEPRYLAAASAAADFIVQEMRRPDGRLLHSWRDGRARFDAYLDDYACLVNSLVTLYEASGEERWIDAAVPLADQILALFQDPAGGGFFFTASDHQKLIARHKDLQDSSVPSGTAMTVTCLLRLGKLCGRSDYLTAAESTLSAFTGLMEQHPTATGQMLLALDMYLGPTPELVLMFEKRESHSARRILSALHGTYLPNKVLAVRAGNSGTPSASLAEAFAGKELAGSKSTLHICQNFVCQEPVQGEQGIIKSIRELALLR